VACRGLSDGPTSWPHSDATGMVRHLSAWCQGFKLDNEGGLACRQKPLRFRRRDQPEPPCNTYFCVKSSAPVKSPIGFTPLVTRALSRLSKPSSGGKEKRWVMKRKIDVVSY
jgi:hypothetical protein